MLKLRHLVVKLVKCGLELKNTDSPTPEDKFLTTCYIASWQALPVLDYFLLGGHTNKVCFSYVTLYLVNLTVHMPL